MAETQSTTNKVQSAYDEGSGTAEAGGVSAAQVSAGFDIVLIDD